MIYATRDLDAATAIIAGGGLDLLVVAGGRHIGLGTHNRIVPLGGGYLELLAVADWDEAAGSEFGRGLLARLAEVGEGLFTWAVAVDAVEPVADRLGLAITTIERQGMNAQLAGLRESMAEPFLPFFIRRDPRVADPAAGGHTGGITWLEVAGDRARLDRWLGGAALPVRVVGGAAGVRAVGIGARELRTG